MKKIVHIFAISIALVVVSCTKYEEGSNFSLLSPKARLVNEWVITEHKVNDVTTPFDSNASLEMLFKRDNSFVRTWVFGPIRVTEEGTWSFVDDKHSVLLNKKDGTIEKHEIIQLKSNALKARSTDSNGNVNLYVFKKK
jgi:hypothetical protein